MTRQDLEVTPQELRAPETERILISLIALPQECTDNAQTLARFSEDDGFTASPVQARISYTFLKTLLEGHPPSFGTTRSDKLTKAWNAMVEEVTNAVLTGRSCDDIYVYLGDKHAANSGCSHRGRVQFAIDFTGNLSLKGPDGQPKVDNGIMAMVLAAPASPIFDLSDPEANRLTLRIWA